MTSTLLTAANNIDMQAAMMLVFHCMAAYVGGMILDDYEWK